MKLSEAIREGAKLRPQCTSGEYFDLDGTSCAMGAAFEAETGHTNLSNDRLEHAFPELARPTKKPINYGTSGSLEYAIARLNDEYKWTREQIADWVEEQGY